MIRSMTAFGRAEQSADFGSVTVEVRAVNSRHLDLVQRLPASFAALEDRIKGLVSQRVSRGRIEMRIQIQEGTQATNGFELDEHKAQAFYQALVRMKASLNLPGRISIAQMAAIPGLIRPAENGTDMDAIWPVVSETITQALNAMDAMRRTEGEFLARDMGARIDWIAASLDRIQDLAKNLAAQYAERLKDRIVEMTRGGVEIDPARIAQEAAFLADRADISEEIVRSRSHLAQFRAMMADPEPAGRKLNFLTQELGREFNTMGVKVGHAQAAHIIVDIKSEIEKIREQIQNVE